MGRVAPAARAWPLFTQCDSLLTHTLSGKGEALARDHAPQGSFIPSLLALRKASALEAQAHAGGLPPDEARFVLFLLKKCSVASYDSLTRSDASRRIPARR